MHSILNRLYHGEIRPEEGEQSMLGQIGPARKRFAQEREKLLMQVEEPVRTQLRRLMEEGVELSALEMEDAYVRGMRMGARMDIALLADKKDLPTLT